MTSPPMATSGVRARAARRQHVVRPGRLVAAPGGKVILGRLCTYISSVKNHQGSMTGWLANNFTAVGYLVAVRDVGSLAQEKAPVVPQPAVINRGWSSYFRTALFVLRG